MNRWIPATPTAAAIDALAQAMLRTGYVSADEKDEFHARVAAGVLIRELENLGYSVTPVANTHGTMEKAACQHTEPAKMGVESVELLHNPPMTDRDASGA